MKNNKKEKKWKLKGWEVTMLIIAVAAIAILLWAPWENSTDSNPQEKVCAELSPEDTIKCFEIQEACYKEYNITSVENETDDIKICDERVWACIMQANKTVVPCADDKEVNNNG